MDHLGRTFTEVHGARSPREFLSGLKRGASTVHGESGDYSKLTRAVWKIGFSMMRERPWTVALSPLAALVPIVTFVNLLQEIAFAQKWGRTISDVAAREVSPVAYAVD